jgi:hypothetical protein
VTAIEAESLSPREIRSTSHDLIVTAAPAITTSSDRKDGPQSVVSLAGNVAETSGSDTENTPLAKLIRNPSTWKKRRLVLDGADQVTEPNTSSAKIGLPSKVGLPPAQASAPPTHTGEVSKPDANLASHLHTLQHPSVNMKPRCAGSTGEVTAYTQGLQLCRDRLFQQAVLDCILVPCAVDSPLRTSIAEEIKARIGCLLKSQERQPRHISGTLKALGKNYWAEVHQTYHRIDTRWVGSWLDNIAFDRLYSKEDIDRALYFWASHHNTMSYGEIASELRLPFKLLLSQIMRFANSK